MGVWNTIKDFVKSSVFLKYNCQGNEEKKKLETHCAIQILRIVSV
jgi:hypothetical protein